METKKNGVPLLIALGSIAILSFISLYLFDVAQSYVFFTVFDVLTVAAAWIFYGAFLKRNWPGIKFILFAAILVTIAFVLTFMIVYGRLQSSAKTSNIVPIAEPQSRLPKGIDGMAPLLTGIQSINAHFKTCTIDQLFAQYSTPASSTNANGTLIFFDYDNNGAMDFVTTNLGDGSMIYASSASASIETKPINYLDEEVFSGGGKKYYRQLDWEKIMAVK